MKPKKSKNSKPISSPGTPSKIKSRPLTSGEINSALLFYDAGEKDEVSASSIHKRLSSLGFKCSTKEIQGMLGNAETITKEEFHKLYDDDNGNVSRGDPVEEVYKQLCGERKVMDKESVKAIMLKLGHGNLTTTETELLMKAAIGTADGMIFLQDFHALSLANAPNNE